MTPSWSPLAAEITACTACAELGPGAVTWFATYHPSAAIRFGPNGAPMAALREELASAAKLVG